MPVVDRTKRCTALLQRGPRALLLAPTRELAVQIHREVERLAQGKKFRVGLLNKSLAVVGRASGAKNALGHFDVMVATPMRLVGVLRQGAVDLSHVKVRASFHSLLGSSEIGEGRI